MINLFFKTGGGASHQHGWIAIGRTRKVDRDRAIVTLQSPDDRSDGVEGLWKNSTIAIGVITWLNRRHSSRGWSSKHPCHDRRPIVAQSWPDRGLILKQSQSNSPLIPGQSVATLKPRSMLTESHPRRWKSALMTRSITHNFKPNFLFKTNVFLFLKLNFWSIREGIRRISKKISSSSLSPCV